jgi:hypothetical protein
MKLNNNIALNFRVNGANLTHYIKTINITELSGRLVNSQDDVLTYINYLNSNIFLCGNGKISFIEPLNLTINQTHHVIIMRGNEEIILHPGTYTNERLHEIAGNELMDEVQDVFNIDRTLNTFNERFFDDDRYDDDMEPPSDYDSFFSSQHNLNNDDIAIFKNLLDESEQKRNEKLQSYISKLDKVNSQNTFLDYDDIIALEQIAVNEYKIQKLIKDNKLKITAEQEAKLETLSEFLMLLPLSLEEERKASREKVQEQNIYYKNNTESLSYEEMYEVVKYILGDIPSNIDINNLSKI